MFKCTLPSPTVDSLYLLLTNLINFAFIPYIVIIVTSVLIFVGASTNIYTIQIYINKTINLNKSTIFHFIFFKWIEFIVLWRRPLLNIIYIMRVTGYKICSISTNIWRQISIASEENVCMGVVGNMYKAV